MRVFYAVEFEREIKEYLHEKLLIVKNKSVSGNFSRKENIHLTLKFIGEVSNTEIEALSHLLDQITAGKYSFDLFMNRIGTFNRRNKSIVWIGTEKNQKLLQLYGDLEKTLSKSGYKEDTREFSPHITLGRQVKLKPDENIADISIDETAKVNKISLMESTRVKGTLTYIPVYTKELG